MTRRLFLLISSHEISLSSQLTLLTFCNPFQKKKNFPLVDFLFYTVCHPGFQNTAEIHTETHINIHFDISIYSFFFPHVIYVYIEPSLNQFEFDQHSASGLQNCIKTCKKKKRKIDYRSKF